MNPQETARAAAVRGLIAHGLTENMAERITRYMVAFQPDEWSRILERAKRGEVRNLYVLVTHFDETRFGTFLYAPAEVNNIAVLTAWLSSKMGAGCWLENLTDEIEPDQEPGAYSVSVFDIAQEVNRQVSGRSAE
jgi:hypothetical protein